LGHIALSKLSSLDQLSQYSAAFHLAFGANLVASMLVMAWLPSATKLKVSDYDSYIDGCKSAFLVASLIGYFSILLFYILGTSLLISLFGKVYESAQVTMVWLSLANLFFLSGLVRAQMILLSNTQHYHIYIVLIGLAFLVPLTYHLAQIRGAEGAAIALCISAFISSILTSFFIPELRNIGYMQIKAILLLGASDLFKKGKISK